MTAWQDQPPQSRRQLRLSEQRGARDESIDGAATEEQHAEAAVRRSVSHEAQMPSDQQPRSRADAAIASGRRSQHAYPEAVQSASEPQASRTDESRTDDVPPAYRVRDFSPESRRSAFSSTSELSASEWGKPGDSGESSDLDYRTEQRMSSGPEAQDAAPQSFAPQSVLPHWLVPPVEAASTAVRDSFTGIHSSGSEPRQPDPEHTLTRRELRALRQSSEGASQPALAVEPAVTPSASQVSQTPPPLRAPAASAPQSSDELSRAMAEFDTLLAHDTTGAPTVNTARVSPPEATLQPSPFASARTAPAADSGAGVQDAQSESKSAGIAELHPAGLKDHDEAVESRLDSGKVYTLPTGHWSTQGAIDDEVQPEGVTLSRNVAAAGGAVTASHLVISSIPTANDLLLPFTPTGEIMVTGTIDLPRSLGTTGAHPARYDHSDVDALLEASDREDSNVDSAPVRAIRAVSTHTSSRGLIGTPKPPRSSRLPMVLAISTAAVAAAVVVLFVAGFVLHLF